MQPFDELTDDSDSPKRKVLTKRTRQTKSSGSRPSPLLPPVDDLTDDSSSHAKELKDVGLPVPRKRKAAGITPRERLVSDAHCKALLGRICKTCKKACLSKFRHRENYVKFMEFRRRWKETHKLDQDKIVSQRSVCVLRVKFLGANLPVGLGLRFGGEGVHTYIIYTHIYYIYTKSWVLPLIWEKLHNSVLLRS